VAKIDQRALLFDLAIMVYQATRAATHHLFEKAIKIVEVAQTVRY
jgi:hypothetical protein